jgi:hypothetical protein
MPRLVAGRLPDEMDVSWVALGDKTDSLTVGVGDESDEN